MGTVEKASAPQRVLLVDDEQNILSSLRRLLRPHGYEIACATGGAEALALLQEQPVDLVISDMRMPEMDGAEFLTEVARLYPDTVRILLTGFADLSSTVEAINRGKIYRYLSKPWEDTDILLTVKQGLQTRHLEREKKRLLALTRLQNKKLAELNAGLEAKVQARTQEIQQTAEMLDLAYEELKGSYKDTIRVLSSVIGMREGLTLKHAQKVAELARDTAQELQLAEDQVQDIYFAGLLHELGKLSLSDALLSRPPYTLNRTALERYRRHPLLGQAALGPVSALQNAGNLIRSHEEYWDGSGFPDRLKGEEIPLGARIIGLAKDFYGLQTGRLSTNSLSPRAALERLEELAGKLYDPELVPRFKTVAGAKLEEARKLPERRIESGKLEPGMKLSRDLYNQAGMLLLTRGRVLSEGLIRKLRAVEQTDDQPFEIYVYLREKSTHD